MAIVQGAAFQGVDVNRVRPGVRDRQGDILEIVAEDQSCAYEMITGIKNPYAATIAATPHVHDGTNGPVIPIPLLSTWINGEFYPSTSELIRGNSGWSPVVRQIQFTPAGVDYVRAWVTVGTVATLQVLRATNFDNALAVFWIAEFTAVGVYDGVVVAYADMQVTPSVLNVFQLEYRTANGQFPLPQNGDRVFSFTVVPLPGGPTAAESYINQGATSTTTARTSSTFFGFQEAAFDDDRPISGHMVRKLATNDAQLYEMATGQPASGMSAVQWVGHCHGAATSVSTVSAHGAVIDQPLLAINFGVRRTRTGKITGRFDDDEAEGTLADMEGRIFCSQLLVASGTAYQTLDAYPFHMPAQIAANIHTGAGLKLKVAALVHVNTTHITSGTVRATILNEALSVSGTSTTLTTSGSGLQIVSGTIDYHGSATVGRTGERAMLSLEAKRDSAYAGSAGSFGILSACLYLEA